MTATWEQVLSAIKTKVPEPTFNRWFRSLSAIETESGQIQLYADDEFDAVFIEKNFAELIRLHLERLRGRSVSLKIAHRVDSDVATARDGSTDGCAVQSSAEEMATDSVVNSSAPVESPAAYFNSQSTWNAGPSPVGPTVTERILEVGLRLQYSFDQFVVGSGNEFAHAASLAVHEKPGHVYNPLFLYGRVGLGKTHLLNAVGIEMLRNDPSKRVIYMTAEAFMNELIEHLKTKRMPQFRARFRSNIDALLIDDIQFIAGKEATQQEFFHTFNALHQSGAQIIITSDKYPHEIPSLEERLRSRFQWGLVADIQPPRIETRIAILQKKAENLDLDLPDAVSLFLAENIRSNVRELEGALLRLHAFVGFNQRAITLDLARTLLSQFLQEHNRKLTVENIQKMVCSYYNVRMTDLKGKSRQRIIVLPRQVAMYLSKKHTGMSYPQLGSKFGGRDHTTVLAAYRKIDQRLQTDKTISGAVQHLEQQIAG